MARRDIGTPVVIGYLAVFWGLVGLLGVWATSNEAPGAPEVKWETDPAFTTTKLDVKIVTDSVDPDGDTVNYTYVWTKNGEVQADKTSKVIAAKEIRVGDVWEVEVTPDDGTTGGYGCSLPWRSCAGDVHAKLSTTIQNSPPTPRIRFVGADGNEVEATDGSTDVTVQLSCLDADLLDADRDAAVAAKAAGTVVDPNAPKVDPCSYQVAWWPADAAPAEGEQSPHTALTLDKKTLKTSKTGWKVVVVANDGQVDGPPTEAVLPPPAS